VPKIARAAEASAIWHIFPKSRVVLIINCTTSPGDYLFYYMDDKIDFFKIQLHFAKSFQLFCKQFGISKLGK
jgi:hypothetical protein